jgi:hypothetical protein
MVFCTLLLGVSPGCTLWKYQNIDRDVASWNQYTFYIDSTILSVGFPPDSLDITPPVYRIKTAAVDDYFILTTVDYDYGLGSYDDIPQVQLRVSVSRLDDGIVCTKDEMKFGDCIVQDSKVSYSGVDTRYVSYGELNWFHEEAAEGETYSFLISENHYLTIEAHYWDDLVKNPAMLADRKGLVRDIVSTVSLSR